MGRRTTGNADRELDVYYLFAYRVAYSSVVLVTSSIRLEYQISPAFAQIYRRENLEKGVQKGGNGPQLDRRKVSP